MTKISKNVKAGDGRLFLTDTTLGFGNPALEESSPGAVERGCHYRGTLVVTTFNRKR